MKKEKKWGKNEHLLLLLGLSLCLLKVSLTLGTKKMFARFEFLGRVKKKPRIMGNRTLVS